MSQNDQLMASEGKSIAVAKPVAKKWPNRREDYELMEVVGTVQSIGVVICSEGCIYTVQGCLQKKSGAI